MKRMLGVIAVAALLAALAAPAGAGDVLNRVMTSKKLVNALDAEYPPFSFLNTSNQMDGFDVDELSTALLYAPSTELPSGLTRCVRQYLVESRQFEDEEKLFSWILDDAFDDVRAALAGGTRLDDAWCKAHQHLVTNPERRAHLAQASVPPRLRKLVDAAAAGTPVERTEVGGRAAVRVVYADGAKQIVVLTADELAFLEAKGIL